uniref:Uncharacterized protein n=1 Tax=Solanum lycopersicum TaxID=4081 RepID=A0A3Q7HBJ3_SOLLC
QKTICGGVAF